MPSADILRSCKPQDGHLSNKGSHESDTSDPQIVVLRELAIQLGVVDSGNHGLGDTDNEQIVGISIKSAQAKKRI